MFDTAKAALYLKELRGIDVKPTTIQKWCQLGKFPNAQRIGGPRRGSWLIPQSDLDALEQRPRGNPNFTKKQQGD